MDKVNVSNQVRQNTNHKTVTCPVCPHHCNIPEGAFGRCRARKNIDGKIICTNYGKITSIALDPIEKKPLAYFHPGSKVLSVGSYGCNLSCPFCQNYEIAAAGEEDFAGEEEKDSERTGKHRSTETDTSTRNRHLRNLLTLYEMTPEELCSIAFREQARGNIGIAFTYNEAMVGYEFVRDCAKLSHEAGMLNVLVTNGMATLPTLEEVLPHIDSMNIDLKGFRPEIYRKLGGDLETVKAFIIRSAQECHVELTSLIVPGLNDSIEDMQAEAEWIASIDPDIPLHITRYFPRYKMHEKATDINLLLRLQKVAQQSLRRVRLGNV